MAQRKLRFLCLAMVLAILAGLFAGCQNVSETTTGTEHTANSIYTSPTTVPVTTVPSVTQTQPVTTAPVPTTTAPLPIEPSTTAPTQPPTTAPTEPPQVTVPKLHAKNAFVYDTRSQSFLYASCDTGAALYPASITKLFTTYVALEYLEMDMEVTVGSELGKVAADASVVGFQKGDVVSVETLVHGALLPSGCDASYILAAAAGRVILEDTKATASTAIAAFIKECNRRALILQMPNTCFANPDGYHKSGHYISMAAMAKIGTLVLENADMATIVAMDTATVSYRSAEGKTCKATLKNSNKILYANNETYYHPLCVGLKTGTTDAAGACLLAAYRVDGGYILIGVFGGTDYNARFTDANALFEAYYPYL